MCRDTPQARRHAKSERLELPRAESVLAERPHGAACLPAEGCPSRLARGRRRTVERRRRPFRARRCATAERWSVRRARRRTASAMIESPGSAPFRSHTRAPASSRRARGSAGPAGRTRARERSSRVARRRIRHAVRALQRDWQERIAVRRLGPRRIRESRNPDRVVPRTDVFDAPQARAPRGAAEPQACVRSSSRASSASAPSSEISPTIGVSRASSSSVLCHPSNVAARRAAVASRARQASASIDAPTDPASRGARRR